MAGELRVLVTDRIRECLVVALTNKYVTVTEEQRMTFEALSTVKTDKDKKKKKKKGSESDNNISQPQTNPDVPLAVIQQLSSSLVEAKKKQKECGVTTNDAEYIKHAWLHEIIGGSEIALPEPVARPKPTPEQERLRQQAQNIIDNRRYSSMVKSITSTKEQEAQERRRDVKQANNAMSLGLNVLVTMATMFVAGWFLCKNAFGSDVAGVIGGLVCSIICMLVEMWLFIIRGSRLDSQEEKNKKRAAVLARKRPVLSAYGTVPPTVKRSETLPSPNFTF